MIHMQNRGSADAGNKYAKQSMDASANPNKVKMTYKKQMNSHRATSTNAAMQSKQDYNQQM
jgi:hypothetical protein